MGSGAERVSDSWGATLEDGGRLNTEACFNREKQEGKKNLSHLRFVRI